MWKLDFFCSIVHTQICFKVLLLILIMYSHGRWCVELIWSVFFSYGVKYSSAHQRWWHHPWGDSGLDDVWWHGEEGWKWLKNWRHIIWSSPQVVCYRWSWHTKLCGFFLAFRFDSCYSPLSVLEPQRWNGLISCDSLQFQYLLPTDLLLIRLPRL